MGEQGEDVLDGGDDDILVGGDRDDLLIGGGGFNTNTRETIAQLADIDATKIMIVDFV